MNAKQYGVPMPIQFDRLYAGPLEKYDTFETYAEALIYAQGPISYPGQRIGVKKSGLKEDVYVINQDKSLSRLMIQREDIHAVLYADKWTGEVPYEQVVSVPYLEMTDNCIISLGESVKDPEVVREIVNAKIGDTIQEEGSIRFIARGDKPTIDIPVTITIGSVVSAVEIPNNVNDNTNHTVVIAKQDAWVGNKPPYTQELYVFGVRPDSNGTIGINPDSSYAQINKMAAATAGVVRYEQKNNSITIAAMNSKPTRDLEILVVWGDEIVVFENSDTLEDFNTSVDLVLKVNQWTENRPYTQTLRVEGLSEYHTGAIGLSDNCTPEEAEIGLNAGLQLIEQGEGYVVVEATDIKPTVDLPCYLTYGSNITIVPAPEYVGEANRHVDTMAYASKWIKTPDGWEQEVEVEGITSNSIGTMGLRNGVTELQTYAAATARIKISRVYDNKVLLTATRTAPEVNLPLCFVFGRNINVAKYPGITGKMALDTNYILFDDSLINSGLSTLQQLLEYNTSEHIRMETEIYDTINEFKEENATEHNAINADIDAFKKENAQQHQTITTNLDNEITRATGAEAAEKARAEAAEKVLTDNLAAEITRATGAEQVLTTNLAAEITRATGAEQVLTTNLDNHIDNHNILSDHSFDGTVALLSTKKADGTYGSPYGFRPYNYSDGDVFNLGNSTNKWNDAYINNLKLTNALPLSEGGTGRDMSSVPAWSVIRSTSNLETYPYLYYTTGEAGVLQNNTDKDGNITGQSFGTVPLKYGGTGATTAANARTNLSVYSISDIDSKIGNINGIQIGTSVPTTLKSGVIYLQYF